MEGRAPQASARPGNAIHGRGRGLWISIAIVAALVAIGLLLAFARSGKDDTLDAYSQAPEISTTAAPLASDDGAAMIVDAGATAGNEAAAAASTPADAAAGTAGGSAATLGVAAADAPAAAAAPNAKARAQRAQARPAQKKGSDDDLLGTLLGIIKQDEKDAPKHESMDSLINKIRAEDQRNTADANAAFDSIDKSKAKSSASTHSEIQVQLRRCPQANTLEGIECRRKICATLSGKDPACPAQ